MTNNEKFNELINECENPQKMLDLLVLLFSKPNSHRSDSIPEESKVVI